VKTHKEEISMMKVGLGGIYSEGGGAETIEKRWKKKTRETYSDLILRKKTKRSRAQEPKEQRGRAKGLTT